MKDRASEALVRALALSRDGKTALSGASDRTITVWDVATRAAVRVLTGHQGPVQAVALSGGGKLGLSGSDDRTLMVWDVATGQAVWTLEGHGGPVMAVALSEDGKTAVSGSDDRTLKVWDVVTGRQLASFSGEAAFRSVALDHSLGILAGDNAGRLHRLALRVPSLARERSLSFGETFIRTVRRFLGGAGS